MEVAQAAVATLVVVKVAGVVAVVTMVVLAVASAVVAAAVMAAASAVVADWRSRGGWQRQRGRIGGDR